MKLRVHHAIRREISDNSALNNVRLGALSSNIGQPSIGQCVDRVVRCEVIMHRVSKNQA